MADKDAYNMRNPAVKRILQEVKEMQKDTSKDFISMPLEEDIFEWQFAIHGPPDTAFEGGIYHGRIVLPPEYPFKPPAFMLLTPSGRFEVQTKICLSISQHHPEHWQPSWSVRTALVALIAFLPTAPDGALGSLDYTTEERRALAAKSRLAPPKFGSAQRQAVINQIHQSMLAMASATPSLDPRPSLVNSVSSLPSAAESGAESLAISSTQSDAVESDPENEQLLRTGQDREAAEDSMNLSNLSGLAPRGKPVPYAESSRDDIVEQGRVLAGEAPLAEQSAPSSPFAASGFTGLIHPHASQQNPRSNPGPSAIGPMEARKRSSLLADESGLTLLAVALLIAILALLAKKFTVTYFNTADTV